MTKWFDAKILSNENAQLLLIREWISVLDWGLKHAGLDHYEDAKGNKLSRRFVYEGSTAEYFRAVNDGADWKAFSKVRRVCNANCIPYQIFCKEAIMALLGMDRVNLDINEAVSIMVLSSIMDAVRERIAHGPIFFATSAYFQPSNYAATDLQIEYTDFIIEKVYSRYQFGKAREIIMKMVESGRLNSEAVARNRLQAPSQENK